MSGCSVQDRLKQYIQLGAIVIKIKDEEKIVKKFVYIALALISPVKKSGLGCRLFTFFKSFLRNDELALDNFEEEWNKNPAIVKSWRNC